LSTCMTIAIGPQAFIQHRSLGGSREPPGPIA
jgi:hypothetical protein